MHPDEYQAAYSRFLTFMHTGGLPKSQPLKPLAKKYQEETSSETESETPSDVTVEFTDTDIKWEQRRAMQEALDRRN